MSNPEPCPPPWKKRYTQESRQEEPSHCLVHNTDEFEWDCPNESAQGFQSSHSNNVTKTTAQESVQQADFSSEEEEEEEEEQLEEYSENTSTSSSFEMAVKAFIQGSSLENLRDSLLDIGIVVSLEQLQQMQSEDIAGLIRDFIYGEPMLAERSKHEDLKSIQDLAKKIEQASNILVVSGAGISVSCGIPDFRSAGGVYERIQERFSLLDPQEIFDLETFKENPEMFYSFAKEIVPGESTMPSLSHRFIRDIEIHNKLLRNYTQNIDGLESVAGVERVVYCHGSFSTAHCLRCGANYSLEDIRPNIVTGKVPYCARCELEADNSGNSTEEEEDEKIPNVIKPDIVFFGEPLSSSFFDCLESDREKADLLLVIGTSLQVAPVSKIPFCISAEIPQVLINLEPVGPCDWFDLELIGPCDSIISRLYQLLGWQHSTNDIEHVKEEQVQPRRWVIQRDT